LPDSELQLGGRFTYESVFKDQAAVDREVERAWGRRPLPPATALLSAAGVGTLFADRALVNYLFVPAGAGTETLEPEGRRFISGPRTLVIPPRLSSLSTEVLVCIGAGAAKAPTPLGVVAPPSRGDAPAARANAVAEGTQKERHPGEGDRCPTGKRFTAGK
jgi:hypothetical protein